MDAQQTSQEDKEEERLALLQDWLALQEKYDHELSRRFRAAMGAGLRPPPQQLMLDTDFEELVRAMRRAKAAYDAQS